MKYELVEELKAAGFPFKSKREIFAYGKETEFQYPWATQTLDATDSGYEFLFPTLEELIEACGEQYITVCGRSGGNWIAFYGDVAEKARTNGASAIEAVARLWIALNKKSAPVAESA
jgi:hypothetical protein